MKLILQIILLIAIHSCSQAQCQSAPAVYVGSTPCSQGTRPLPGMDTQMPCELMKWKLFLYRRTFELHCEYGMPKQNTKGFEERKTVDLSGSWTVEKSKGRTIYQLRDERTGRTFSFLRLSGELLHLLDADWRLMIGNGGWSYTLSKIVAP